MPRIPAFPGVALPPPGRDGYPVSMSNPRAFPVVLVRDEDDMFSAECPILRGCFSQGATRAEALANIQEAIELTLECQVSEGWTLPEGFELTSVPVPLAA